MTSSYGLQGRAAIVTGGTRGIGLAVARALAGAGGLVCVTARDADEVRRTARELGGIGLAGTVADPARPRELTDLVLREFGRIDVLVNNAATKQPYGPLMDVDADAWREAFAVNVEAPLRLVQCAGGPGWPSTAARWSTSARRAPVTSGRTSARTAPARPPCCT